jgi:hypothetical protein
MMKLSRTERKLLSTFVAVAQKMLGSTADSARPNGDGRRRRRSAQDVALMKKHIRAARRRNVPVKAIAEELGVTSSYIYQLEK